MMYRCEQRGCGEYAEDFFDSDSDERNCPVCNNPLVITGTDDDDAPWSDFSAEELRGHCEAWELEGWNSKTSKPDLIALLEAAEAAEAAAE